MTLNNCELEFSYIQAELFKKCLKESCFPDGWKVALVVPVFKNIGERSTASLLSVVSKVFEKPVNNRIVDHVEKYGLFSDFQYCFIALALFFFNCYLAAPRPIWAIIEGTASLTHPMLITAFFYIFGPKVTGSLVASLGY